MHLGWLIARRLASIAPILFVVSIAVYGMILFIPGDPALTLAGENPTEAQVAAIRENLGLDDPLIVQYGRWVSDAVRGDLGESLVTRRPVLDSIVERFGVTASLTACALVVALLVGLPLGLLSALRPRSVLDRLSTVVASLGVAVPNFWLALMLVLVFAVWLGWLPALGYTAFSTDPVQWIRSMALPAITLGTAAAAEVARQLRSSMREVLSQDYIRTARSKGLDRSAVVGKHAMKNAAIPVVTALGFQVATLLGGTVVVERIFGLPGLGQLAIGAVLARDLPVIQGVVVFTAVIVIVVNVVVDLLYMMLNPKVRL